MKQSNLDSQNFIIKSVSEETFKQLEGDLEKVEMPLTQSLSQSWTQISHVYFPETSVISVVSVLENGNGVETGIIGKEGVWGATAIFAQDISLGEITVQLGGEGWRMDVGAFKALFDCNFEFREIVLSYVFTFVTQITQNALCLCYHSIEKRLARWLLMFQDRAENDVLVLTQEFLAQMLGVHRPSVSKSANKLQTLNLIRYTRGVVQILDRDSLENFACECYKTVSEVNEMVRKK